MSCVAPKPVPETVMVVVGGPTAGASVTAGAATAMSQDRMAAERDPIRKWREEYGRRVLNLDFAPLSDAPFRATFDLTCEDPSIVRTAFSPG